MFYHHVTGFSPGPALFFPWISCRRAVSVLKNRSDDSCGPSTDRHWAPAGIGSVPRCELGDWKWWCQVNMAMDQYLLIPFLVGWTSIYQLFWCSPGVQGFDTLPHDGWLRTGFPWDVIISNNLLISAWWFNGLEHEFYDFPYIGNNTPIWLFFFQRGWNHQSIMYTG